MAWLVVGSVVGFAIAIGANRGHEVLGPAKASLEASLEASMRFMAADLGPRGIRVNAISAAPIKTLAAAGTTGDVIYVDAGYRRSSVGAKARQRFGRTTAATCGVYLRKASMNSSLVSPACLSTPDSVPTFY